MKKLCLILTVAMIAGNLTACSFNTSDDTSTLSSVAENTVDVVSETTTETTSETVSENTAEEMSDNVSDESSEKDISSEESVKTSSQKNSESSAESSKSTESSKSQENSKSSTSSKSEDTSKPKEQSKPTETSKSDTSSKPTETSRKPAETSKPTETSKPVETSKPTESSKPSEPSKPSTVEVTSITLNKTNVTLGEGKTITLTATVNPSNANNKTITWSSDNTSIVTVNNGKVTAKKAGTANIIAKSNNGKTATCKVTITHEHNWVAQTKTVHHDATYKYEDVYENYIEKIYYSGVCANDGLLNQEGYIKDPLTGKISFSKDYLGEERYSLTPWGVQTPWWMLFEHYNLCTLDDILNLKYDWVTVETKERKYEDYEPEFYENGYTKEVQVIYHINGSKIPREWSSKCLDYCGSTTTKKSLIKSIPHHEKVGTKKVIDKVAYDETIITGYKCSCGATK